MVIMAVTIAYMLPGCDYKAVRDDRSQAIQFLELHAILAHPEVMGEEEVAAIQLKWSHNTQAHSTVNMPEAMTTLS